MTNNRIASIDWTRGVIMVLMALDHARYYFSDLQFQPEDMAHTWLALFATRWVTHFCAPLFFHLAGMSAWLRGRKTGLRDLRRYLFTRGLLLVVLELTIVGFAWTFKPGFGIGGVIWCLGWSMVILSALVGLDARILLGVSIAVIAGHNLLDGIALPLIRNVGTVHGFFILYPLIPWFAVMVLGYACGVVFEWTPERRRRVLLVAGVLAIALFAVLRVTNAYGEPSDFKSYGSWELTTIAFLNVEKYPASLQYLLMTLGPGFIALALMERKADPFFVLFGRVPLFFYILHLYVIHTMALLVALISGQPHGWLGWGGTFPTRPPAGYGYGLPGVYAAWIAATIVLYACCRWWVALRSEHRIPWSWRRPSSSHKRATESLR